MHATRFTTPNLLSAQECSHLLENSEARGFGPAPVTTGRGFVMMPDLRNNTRVIADDPALAATLWGRIRAALPREAGAWSPVGLNERFRFYRYDPGQAFRWHRDGAFQRSDDERSFLTFMVYLNDGFEGGETEFEDAKVVPASGLALVFSHGLRHQGAEVLRGRKYVLRSDVMYQRVPVRESH